MRRLTVAIVGLLMLPVWCFAGKDFATLAGTVQDSTGRFMSGALVSVTGTTGMDRMALTDIRGAFSFESILPGEYLVQVTMPRFSPTQKEKVRVEAGARVNMKFTLVSIAAALQRSE